MLMSTHRILNKHDFIIVICLLAILTTQFGCIMDPVYWHRYERIPLQTESGAPIELRILKRGQDKKQLYVDEIQLRVADAVWYVTLSHVGDELPIENDKYLVEQFIDNKKLSSELNSPEVLYWGRILSKDFSFTDED